MKQLLVVALALIPSLAHADGIEQNAPAENRSQVSLVVGLATPVGEVGAEYALAVQRHLEIAFGAGLGFSSSNLPQLAVMPRATTQLGPVKLALGLGMSEGPWNNVSAFADDNAKPVSALWTNAEASVQLDLGERAFVRLFGGAGMLTAHSQPEQMGDAGDYTNGTVLPYVGLGFGARI
ncbi:MAG: hypothetical protein QM831_31805 [Kofleriaceae bacterium]